MFGQFSYDSPPVAGGGGSGGGGSPEFTATNDNAGDLVIGSLVYIKSNGNVDKANAGAASTTDAVGLVKATVGTGAEATIVVSGPVTATTGEWDAVTGQTGGLTPGAVYYLSSTTAGRLTTIAPATPGHHVVRLGIAISTIQFLAELDAPILL